MATSRGEHAIKRLVRLLRSPKLALWLVLAVTAYSLFAAMIPQTGLTDPETILWMAKHAWWTGVLRPLGLFAAFTTPVFLLLILMLTASTAVCAWDRTRAAFRLWNTHASVTESLVARLREHPQILVAADDGSLDRCAAALSAVGLAVKRGPRLLVGTSGRWGLLGSPAFHWALVVFFVVVSAGQLTRSDGQMGIPVGASRPDAAESYGTLTTGRFFTGHSGLRLSVPRIEKRNIVDGIDREPAPFVVLSDGTRELRSQLVYPNNPLRYGALVVHRGPFGFSLPISLETSAGLVAGSTDILVDLDESSPLGTAPSPVHLEAPGRSIDVTLTLVPARGRRGTVILETQRRMSVRLDAAGASVPTTVTAPGRVALPDGLVLKLGSVSNYARITVVNDWSVSWIYALLGIGMAGLSVAMLAPHRVVRVMLVDTAKGAELHASISQPRRDPLFAQRAKEAIEAAAARPAHTVDRLA